MSVKRLLDCTPSDLAAYRMTDLLDAIAGSEGRVLACETIGLTPPLLVDVTNAEYAASETAQTFSDRSIVKLRFYTGVW